MNGVGLINVEGSNMNEEGRGCGPDPIPQKRTPLFCLPIHFESYCPKRD